MSHGPQPPTGDGPPRGDEAATPGPSFAASPYGATPAGHWDGPGEHTAQLSAAGAGGARSHRTRMSLAIAAATLMVAGTTVGGFLLTRDGDGNPPPPAAAGEADTESDGTGADADAEEDADLPEGEDDGAPADEDEAERPSDPRGSPGGRPEPVSGDDWQVQYLADRDVVYDVPDTDEWDVRSPDTILGWGEKEPEEEGGLTTPQFVGRGTALFNDAACGRYNSRAVTAVTGARGATGTADAAEGIAHVYVNGIFDPDTTGEYTLVDAEPFSNAQGFEGHIATGLVTGYEPSEDADPECAATSAAVVAVAYLDGSHDVQVWFALLEREVDDALDDDTLATITDSLRHFHTN
ncbi:hypothetical protein [Streptomyces spiramenti]|uniref:DUF8017 domain-containing protein n=1 Tax=Streptomyces spiramenti TaxID=2720606 RepID=A0ABX1AFX6_9ACTN|nr:hypothetical protein [Streptomyces spiramenti]NJP64861.1 hypothetical protein [Streptomyces spiramenti]